MKKTNNRTVTLEGMMTLGKSENGLRTADFMCCEDVQVEPFTGQCKVQMMRDGNVYITALPKRVRNKPVFREDNASLTKGRDGRWYFYFSLDEDQLGLLPGKLTKQASTIAQKVLRLLTMYN